MEQIEIRRNLRVALAIGIAALIVAALFVARGGAWMIVGVALVALAAFYGWVAYDGRVPLMIIDEQGVRARTGRSWRGLPWSHVREVEHLPVPRGVRGWWREGRLTVRQYDGEELGLQLGLGTRTLGSDGDLSAAIARLAPVQTAVVEIDESLDPAATDTGEPDLVDAPVEGPAATEHTSVRLERIEPEAAPEPSASPAVTEPAAVEPSEAPVAPEAPEPVPPVAASPSPAPLRDVTRVVRADIGLGPRTGGETGDVAPEVVEDLHAVAPDMTGIVPAVDPVIGPELSSARERLALSVDQLAQRTRIRPHVIEAMEVDDFAPCGGDFYARGHLRTLARVLGLDATPLLAAYDERYADAPVDPRAVFRAELAQADNGALRRLKGGPNWSVLVAAVMAVVLIWSVARLITAGGAEPRGNHSMALQSSTYGKDPYAKVAAPVPVTLDAAGGGAHVIVRDASSAVVFSGDLAFGETKTLKVSPPLRIQSSDGSLAVSVDGAPASAIGRTGEPAQRTYTTN